MDNKFEDQSLGIILHGLDLKDVTSAMNHKSKRFMAMTLQSIDELIGDSEDYPVIRKAVLDGFNNYTRSLARLFFGDIEDGPSRDYTSNL